ncbi:uncharacterized protein LOC111046079 [Nilaparvata lugens]|uniref:uncharacterized protein LOC111046079 n=1 Tax=Nilaparvata lugens TaxID=108931 RepID=UPI00193CC288|nr:uncharacterized protein LOC111046079 [Nilaparvata lugens]
MLLHSQLEKLSLAFGVGDVISGFTFIKSRCNNLRHLNLSYLRHLNPGMLIDLLPNLKKLVSLNLRMTLAVDEVLGVIGKNCTDLLDLNISGTPVTDRGLVQLSVSESGNPQCQKLSRIVITETWISSAGAAVLLRFLPNLCEFDYDNIFEALDIVNHWTIELEQRLLSRGGVRMSSRPIPIPNKMRLKTLISITDIIRTDSLQAAVRQCPDATSVSITNAWIKNEDLYKLMVLDKLTTLSLTNCDGLTLDFDVGVLPLLTVCGHQLHSLILTNFTNINIPDIGKACPVIHNIAFSSVATYELGPLCPDYFNKLEAMELWADTDADLHANLIRQMIEFSPNMKNLLLKGCGVLTDKLLFEILQENKLGKLSHLTLDHCHNVSFSALEYIANMDNDLSMLRIWSCESITKSVSSQVTSLIENGNMDIYFDFYT